MIHVGKWKTIGGQVVEVMHDEEGYYIILDRSGIQDRLYYDEDGKCYRDRKLNHLNINEMIDFTRNSKNSNEMIDFTRNSKNSAKFISWDLVECMEEIISIKRNSNPILTLELCTE